MSEFKKYFYRFGLVLLIVLPLLYIICIIDEKDFRLVIYKICLVFIAVGIAELIWVVFFKSVYGPTEKMPNVIRQNIMLFRGLLYAAIVLGFTLGL